MKNINEIWGLYDQMRPQQIEAIQKKTPIAYLPWGAIEYHGNHNPTGLDSIKALNLCIDLAKEKGGLVFPVVHLAANLIKSYPGVDFPKHSIEFSEKLIRNICEEYLEQLVQQDFKIIVLLSGHAGEPHQNILKSVAKEFNKKYPDNYFWAFAEFDILPDDLLVANHSALGETSLQLYYAPTTVDLDSLPKDREICLELDAVSGKDPRLATKEFGEKIVKTYLKNASIKLEELIQIYI
ncbi:creatininase family protein [Polaribacter sp. MSW13]|uniref:Creatininase family protein n=1 Tax=Polaribacter marinus TaxID=2916838 RepID=A0A9X1VPH6_9FLAO|nr:creatininase family protein [Polaribacter marinus]MCI2229833.1 creatininase family protein [Polaribacter marinus]